MLYRSIDSIDSIEKILEYSIDILDVAPVSNQSSSRRALCHCPTATQISFLVSDNGKLATWIRYKQKQRWK
jgi:hypothetical protein